AIRKSLEGTLGRLGSSYVDVLQLHYPDAATVGNAAIWQTLEALKTEGKIRYYGIALGPGPGGLEEGRTAMRKHDLGSIQAYYNILGEEPGRTFDTVAHEINQCMVIRAPHAGGVLESDASAVSFPADGDLQTKDAAWIDRARKQATNLRWIYEGKGMTLSQAALKFILSEETVASAIPNIYREEQLAEYSAVSDFETFSQVELGEIAEQFRKGFGVWRRMILGYVDVEDRIYDLNFATLRLRVRIEALGPKEGSRVTFSQVAGAGSASYRILEEADAIAEVLMDHDGKRVPLLR